MTLYKPYKSNFPPLPWWRSFIVYVGIQRDGDDFNVIFVYENMIERIFHKINCAVTDYSYESYVCTGRVMAQLAILKLVKSHKLIIVPYDIFSAKIACGVFSISTLKFDAKKYSWYNLSSINISAEVYDTINIGGLKHTAELELL